MKKRRPALDERRGPEAEGNYMSSVGQFSGQSNTPRDVLANIRITDVWFGLGGGELRHNRGRAWWRDGDGWNVSLDDAKGTWYDFTAGVGGGVFDLIILARGGNRAGALRWCADLAGIELDDKPLSAANRAQWAAERSELERELPEARLWRRAAIDMSEELLDVMKGAFWGGPADKIDFDGIRDTTRLLSRLGRIDGAEYHWWVERYPGMTAAMCHAARRREQIELATLEEYLGITRLEAAA